VPVLGRTGDKLLSSHPRQPTMLLPTKHVEVVAPSIGTVISLSQAFADPCSFFHWEQDITAVQE
jgi:hypothetical protein